jgi:serine/threonine protein phosphatase 1
MAEDLIFAVGDIHGRLDLAQAAVEAIVARAGAQCFRAIFLGDYIDRGPASRGVVDVLMYLTRDPRFVCLKGNHEAMMAQALMVGDSDDFARWMDAGGDATVASYGAHDFASAAAQVPASHLRWMAGLPLTSGDGFRIYVHAGLLPATPFERQTEETCLWVRERFLRAPAHQFDSHIVHGHTPLWAGKPDPGEPERLAHRTNLDLAAYMTDRLGVGVFNGGAGGGPIEILVITQAPGQQAGVTVLPAPNALAAAGEAGGRAPRSKPRTWRR